MVGVEEQWIVLKGCREKNQKLKSIFVYFYINTFHLTPLCFTAGIVVVVELAYCCKVAKQLFLLTASLFRFHALTLGDVTHRSVKGPV